MLTAHSLCWLCQMPLAVARWDLLPLQPRLLACPRSARSAACRRRHPVTLRPLPAKAASRHRLVAVNDYRPPLSGLVQQLKFHHRPELGPPSRVCCCSAFCSVTICRQ